MAQASPAVGGSNLKSGLFCRFCRTLLFQLLMTGNKDTTATIVGSSVCWTGWLDDIGSSLLHVRLKVRFVVFVSGVDGRE